MVCLQIQSTNSRIREAGQTQPLEEITEQLASHIRCMGLWASSIGNEFMQIVTSALTVESGPDLDRMAAGVMERCCTARQLLHPAVCGCCVSKG